MRKDGELVGYAFFCPGCRHGHVFWTVGNKTWDFDGNVETPTFTPSLLNTAPDHVDPTQRVCHLNLTAGKLVFHPDSTHALAGQIIELAERPPST